MIADGTTKVLRIVNTTFQHHHISTRTRHTAASPIRTAVFGYIPTCSVLLIDDTVRSNHPVMAIHVQQVKLYAHRSDVAVKLDTSVDAFQGEASSSVTAAHAPSTRHTRQDVIAR